MRYSTTLLTLLLTTSAFSAQAQYVQGREPRPLNQQVAPRAQQQPGYDAYGRDAYNTAPAGERVYTDEVPPGASGSSMVPDSVSTTTTYTTQQNQYYGDGPATRVHTDTVVSYDPEVAPSSGGAPDYEPPVMLDQRTTQNGIRFVTGGVGEDEKAAIKSMANQYSLEVLVSYTSGHFLADHSLRIRNSQGQVIFDEVGSGPFYLVALPPGKYTVESIRPDSATPLTKSVTVGKGHSYLSLAWPGSPSS